MEWRDLKIKILECAKDKGVSKEHIDRILFEFKEIEKQGAEDYWLDLYQSKKTFDSNKNGLVIPWLLGITPIDPVAEGIEPNIVQSKEFPDIDVDLQSEARDRIKEYAIKRYGEDYVSSVGLWQTYKPKSALQDAARAYGEGLSDTMELTKNLPLEFDDMSVEKARQEFDEFIKFEEKYPNIVNLAYKMVNRIKSQGKHAGGIIISSVPIKEYVPLHKLEANKGEGRVWTSAWTEGRSMQLSKFGFIKFDFLGLRTIQYVQKCSKLVEKNYGISFDWSDISPKENRAGWTVNKDGVKKPIPLNDQHTFNMANEIKTESTFQFDSSLSKSIIAKGGIKSFNDIMAYTSLGRPGPLPMVDEYIKRRDGQIDWAKKQNPIIAKILEETYGIVVYQEQLAAIWHAMAGFTVPEAEAARKAVAKKKTEQLVFIRDKWIKGATKKLGEKAAREWWDKMETFGRYAFNKAHAASYSIIIYQTLYLKAHYPAEWWATAMADCDRERLPRYMGTARLEGIKFTSLDVNNLSSVFTARDNRVILGLNMIKGIGAKADSICEKPDEIEYKSIHEFLDTHEVNRTIMERMIKLGAFDKIHKNRKALWSWWRVNYGGDKTDRELKRALQYSLRWPKKQIDASRNLLIAQYFTAHPNRKKVPNKLLNWVPTTPNKEATKLITKGVPDRNTPKFKEFYKIKIDLDDVERLIKNDYSLKQILRYEKEYLGFYLHSPMDLFKHRGYTIETAKHIKILECVIKSVEKLRSQAGNEYYVAHVTDGIETAKIMIWKAVMEMNDEDIVAPGVGVTMRVRWSEKFRNFSIENGSAILPLEEADDVDY